MALARRCCSAWTARRSPSWTRYVERGVMPFLGELAAARRTRATLRSIMPPLTPPAWTSLMTGKRPGQHGVFDFFQKEAPDSEYFRSPARRTSRSRDDLVAGQRAGPAHRRR